MVEEVGLAQSELALVETEAVVEEVGLAQPELALVEVGMVVEAVVVEEVGVGVVVVEEVWLAQPAMEREGSVKLNCHHCSLSSQSQRCGCRDCSSGRAPPGAEHTRHGKHHRTGCS